MRPSACHRAAKKSEEWPPDVSFNFINQKLLKNMRNEVINWHNDSLTIFYYALIER
ncbi:MAG: hypothetical protein ACTSPW_00010 [Promethearchaeota archaeon]